MIPPINGTPNTQPAHIFGQRERRMLQVGLDLETTSTDPSRARIVQFASIARCPGWLPEPVESNFLVNPQQPIPLSATEIHGISDAQVADKQTLSERLPQIVELLSRATQPGACIVGYNVRRYDFPLLQHALAQLGMIGSSPIIVDVCDLVNWHLRELPSRKLGKVAEYLGVGFETNGTFKWLLTKTNSGKVESSSEVAFDRAHDALSDVRATFRILDKLRERLKLTDNMLGDMELVRLSILAAVRVDAEYDQYKHYVYRDRDSWDSPQSAFRLGFGKHCGRLLSELREQEPRYCRWLEKDVIPEAPIAARDVFKLLRETPND